MAKTLLDDIIESVKGIDGRLINQSGTTKQMISDLNYKVVAPAKSAADSAQSAADAAVASAQVTSDAVSAIASATAEAKQGANEAMSRAKSAWDVAIGAKSAVTDFDPLLKSAQSDASKALTQIADTASALSDAKTAFGSDVAEAKELANTAQTTADSAVAVASDASSNATVAVQTASGASLTATNAQGDATIAKQTASEAKVQASNAESDFAQLSIRANKIEANVATNSGAIASVQQTANGLTTSVGNVDDRVKTIEDKTNWTTKTGPLDMDTLTTTQNIYYRDADLKNADGETGWAYIQVVSVGERVTQTVWHDRSSIQHTRTGALNLSNSNYNWDAWNEVATNAQVVQVKQTVDGIATTINDPKTGLNATYQTATGNATTISNVKGDVTQLQTTANGLTSRVGNLESKTDTQQTAIEQNKAAIALKADQTDVDTVKGTVAGLQSSLTVQGNQIQSKVSASDVSGMLTGYATQSYTQSLVTQKADQWNLNLTSLQTDVNAIKTTGGGVNLLTGTSGTLQTYSGSGWGSGNLSSTRLSLVPGQTYTAKLWIQGYDVPTRLVTRSYNGSGVLIAYAYGNTIGANSSGYSIVTWNADSNWTSNVVATLSFTSSQSATHSGQYKELMIEEGTVAHTWSPAPSDMATVTSVTNLSATVDGIKSTVATKADQSTVTELSNLIQTKVSSGDYNSQITQLKNDINLRVAKGDVISQINQEAGGDTLIQVSNGKKSLILDAANTIITGEAWIPGAAIGSLDASKLTFYGANNTYATIGASVAQYDDDNQKSTINLQYNGGIEIHSSNQQGSILTMHDNTIRLASKSWGDNPNAYQYSGFYAAPNYSLMNTYHKDGTTSGVAIDDDRIHIYGSSKDNQLGALQADVGWYSINGQTGLLTGKQISLKAGNTQAVLTDNNININNASDTNDKNYDVAIHVKGWAEMTGWFTCMGITQTSLLSTKTRIEPLDTKVALDKIASTNVETYQFKSDVAKGKTKRHASVIIDDVNDVAEYYTPEEFISENRMGRDDGDIIGYLMGAVQELKKQLDELKEKI